MKLAFYFVAISLYFTFTAVKCGRHGKKGAKKDAWFMPIVTEVDTPFNKGYYEDAAKKQLKNDNHYDLDQNQDLYEEETASGLEFVNGQDSEKSKRIGKIQKRKGRLSRDFSTPEACASEQKFFAAQEATSSVENAVISTTKPVFSFLENSDIQILRSNVVLFNQVAAKLGLDIKFVGVTARVVSNSQLRPFIDEIFSKFENIQSCHLNLVLRHRLIEYIFWLLFNKDSHFEKIADKMRKQTFSQGFSLEDEVICLLFSRKLSKTSTSFVFQKENLDLSFEFTQKTVFKSSLFWRDVFEQLPFLKSDALASFCLLNAVEADADGDLPSILMSAETFHAACKVMARLKFMPAKPTEGLVAAGLFFFHVELMKLVDFQDLSVAIVSIGSSYLTGQALIEYVANDVSFELLVSALNTAFAFDETNPAFSHSEEELAKRTEYLNKHVKALDAYLFLVRNPVVAKNVLLFDSHIFLSRILEIENVFSTFSPSYLKMKSTEYFAEYCLIFFNYHQYSSSILLCVKSYELLENATTSKCEESRKKLAEYAFSTDRGLIDGIFMHEIFKIKQSFCRSIAYVTIFESLRRFGLMFGISFKCTPEFFLNLEGAKNSHGLIFNLASIEKLIPEIENDNLKQEFVDSFDSRFYKLGVFIAHYFKTSCLKYGLEKLEKKCIDSRVKISEFTSEIASQEPGALTEPPPANQQENVAESQEAETETLEDKIDASAACDAAHQQGEKIDGKNGKESPFVLNSSDKQMFSSITEALKTNKTFKDLLAQNDPTGLNMWEAYQIVIGYAIEFCNKEYVVKHLNSLL